MKGETMKQTARVGAARAPLPPNPDAIERQYGEDAELYAEVRSETAAAMGRENEAREWKEAQAEIEDDEDEEKLD